jgi:hypothetical protein
MTAAPRLAPLFLSCFLFALPSCKNGDDDDTGTPDTGATDLGEKDAEPDAAQDAGTDTGTPDSGEPMDVGENDAVVGDAGNTTTITAGALNPGVGVTVDGTDILIGVDTYDTVTTKLAGASSSAIADSRSYEYAFTNTTLTIWFANTDLDANPVNMVQGADLVLWIAVSEGFPGTTPDGVGLDSTRADVEGAYGAAPHTVDLTNPIGTLAQYYTTGALFAYESNDDVRTVTICRAYAVEPDGELDPMGASVTFNGGDIQGSIDIGNLGTRRNDVESLLGPADAEGTVSIDGNSLDTLSYGFIGLEVFFLEGGTRTLFFTVHPPYYGTTSTGLGLGATRVDMEAYLTGLGYAGMASSNAALTCYDSGNPPMVGVTYTTPGDLVSSITFALPACP